MNEDGFDMYKLASQGFCCTQIMLKMTLEEENKENVDLIKAVHGLCGGVGFSRRTCGVLTGGICVLGLYAGKGEAVKLPDKNYMSMMKDYIEWFQNEFESSECSDIIRAYVLTDENGNVNYPVKCGDVMLKAYEKIQEILFKYGYEFGERD